MSVKTVEQIKSYIKHYEKRCQEAQERIRKDPQDWDAYLERRGTAAAAYALKWVLEESEEGEKV